MMEEACGFEQHIYQLPKRNSKGEPMKTANECWYLDSLNPDLQAAIMDIYHD